MTASGRLLRRRRLRDRRATAQGMEAAPARRVRTSRVRITLRLRTRALLSRTPTSQVRLRAGRVLRRRTTIRGARECVNECEGPASGVRALAVSFGQMDQADVGRVYMWGRFKCGDSRPRLSAERSSAGFVACGSGSLAAVKESQPGSGRPDGRGRLSLHVFSSSRRVGAVLTFSAR